MFPSLVPLLRLPRVLRRAREAVGVVASLSALAACGDISRLVTPGSRGTAAPARVSLSASVAASIGRAEDVVSLRVMASYVRKDASRVPIGTQTLALSAAESQAVPIPVDVAACLADPLRENSAGTETSCPVVLNIALIVNGAVVDEQVIGPLRLSPGATTNVAEPVSLFDIASLDVSVGTGPVLASGASISTTLGGTVSLAAKVLDARRVVVPNRAVVWSSDAPGIATIGASSGVITTVGIGTARITATSGTVSSAVVLTVARPPAALTVATGGSSGAGVVRSVPAGIDCRVNGPVASGVCSFTFPGDAAVTLSSTADAGAVFSLWGDACVGASIGANCQVTMSRAQQVSAVFTALRRVSITASAGDGRGRVTGTQGVDCRITAGATSGTCSVDVADGTTVTLTAVPEPTATGGASRQTFGGWAGDCASAVSNTCVLAASSTGKALSANFFDERTLAVTLAGNGAGRVTSTAGIDCALALGATSGTCSATALHGTVAVLTASADAASTFAGWSGACAGQLTSVCTVALTQARAASATFSKRQFTLSLALIGAGAGTVTVNGAAACVLVLGQGGSSCALSFDVGARAVVGFATTSPSQFDGFSGDCSGIGACSLDMTASRSVIATFSRRQIPLNILLSGSGSGTVLVNGTIACTMASGQGSASCTRLADLGTVLTIGGTAGEGSTFVGLGGDCGEALTCSLTMSGPRGVTAVFTRPQIAVTVNLSGFGAGQVQIGSTAPCSIALGQGAATCSRLVDAGSTVALSATAPSGSVFFGFGAPCPTGASTCSLLVTAPLSVGAVFNQPKVPLTIQLSGGGAGSVFVNGTACTSEGNATTCTQQIEIGTSVIVTASPGANSQFLGFSGACSGTASCNFVVAGATSIGANFVPTTVPVTVLISGNGRGTVQIGSTAPCVYDPATGAPSCTRQIPYGSTVIIGKSAGPGTVVGTFGAPCPATGNTCSLTVFSPQSVSVTFTFVAPGASPPGSGSASMPQGRP